MADDTYPLDIPADWLILNPEEHAALIRSSEGSHQAVLTSFGSHVRLLNVASNRWAMERLLEIRESKKAESYLGAAVT